MAQRKTLTEKQVLILRWIGDGCPDGRMTDDFHRITAGALRNRGLVTTTGSGPTWSARITKAGRDYLEEVDGPNPPIARGGHVSVAERLVREVIAADGVLRVPHRRWEPGFVDYERRARLAEQHRKLPPNTRFELRAAQGELEIRLVEAPATPPRPELGNVPVPVTVSRYHRVARAFRDDKFRHEVSRELLMRAVRIVHAIAVEAERRGWAPQVVERGEVRYGNGSGSPAQQGHLQLAVGDRTFGLRVSEEQVHLRGGWEDDVQRYRNIDLSSSWWGGRTVPRGPYDADGSGRLRIEILKDHRWSLKGHQSTWADRQTRTLEDRLPHVFREIEERVIALDRRDEEARVEQERRAAEAIRRAEERERVWRRLVGEARDRLAENERIKSLRSQVAYWTEAEQIRSYCAAVEAAHSCAEGTGEWVAWSRAFADRLDPVTEPPVIPDAPEPTPEALQPFMPPGWSARSPEGR